MSFRRMLKIHVVAVSLVTLTVTPSANAAAQTGYTPKATVKEPTRLDWVFPLANQSPKTPPAGWLPTDYDSAQQTYELYVPPAYADRKAWPLIVFVSPSDGAMGWRHLKDACMKNGILFAGPHAAGNGCPIRKRVRIVMDVLDDVRRKYHIDTDRTYIGGFSGGGRVACAIGFALPELFGGVFPVCAGGDLREETWLRHRVIDRLSIAHVTGGSDFNRGEVERYRGPMLEAVGVRSRVWLFRGMGHSVPSGKAWFPILKWLEDDVGRRRKYAKTYPASRIDGRAAPAGDEWAKQLLAEAQGRLKKADTMYSGLRQLVGIRQRWPDTRSAEEALKILRDYESRKVRPWEKDDIAEQRTFLIARARALDSYATGPLPRQYTRMRSQMLKAAVQLWKNVEKSGADAAVIKQAKERIPVLEEQLKKSDDKKPQ